MCVLERERESTGGREENRETVEDEWESVGYFCASIHCGGIQLLSERMMIVHTQWESITFRHAGGIELKLKQTRQIKFVLQW